MVKDRLKLIAYRAFAPFVRQIAEMYQRLG
jgi:hypothetical protein